jgi:hypothetical protein
MVVPTYDVYPEDSGRIFFLNPRTQLSRLHSIIRLLYLKYIRRLASHHSNRFFASFRIEGKNYSSSILERKINCGRLLFIACCTAVRESVLVPPYRYLSCGKQFRCDWLVTLSNILQIGKGFEETVILVLCAFVPIFCFHISPTIGNNRYSDQKVISKIEQSVNSN